MKISASRLWFDNEKIYVELNDKRIINVPLSLYPKLKKATPRQRQDYELWEQGKWIHWEALDEDLSAEGFLKHQKHLQD